MGICPNCGSWVDEGDICNNYGGGSYYDDAYERNQQTFFEEENEPIDPQDEALELYRQHKHYKASDTIEISIRLYNDPNSWNIKGIILHDLAFSEPHRFAESVDCYNISLKLGSSEIVKNNKAICLCDWALNLDHNRQYELALEKINEALPLYKEKDLDYAFGLNAKAIILNRMNMVEQAKSYYKQALTYDSKNKIFKDNLENIERIVDYEYVKEKEIHEILERYDKRKLVTMVSWSYPNAKFRKEMILTIKREQAIDENGKPYWGYEVFSGDARVGVLLHS